MRSALPAQDESDERWECEECLDRDMEREPLDLLEPVQVHEDGHDKAVMVGSFYDEAMVDEWEAEADGCLSPSPAYLGMYGEG